MNSMDEVGQFSVDIIREAFDRYWNSLPRDEYYRQLLHLDKVREAKVQISFFGAQTAAYIHNLQEAGFDIIDIMPWEYTNLYNYFMNAIPDTIKKVALIGKYINQEIPEDLIISLIGKKPWQ